VRHEGALGSNFQSYQGVKQGDPLSPLLFCLFIDRFEKFITDRLPAAGAQVAHKLIRVLLYADDLVLLADSIHDLQAMLDVLHEFCCFNAMTVNIKNSRW